jgi:hypothetical protein
LRRAWHGEAVADTISSFRSIPVAATNPAACASTRHLGHRVDHGVGDSLSGGPGGVQQPIRGDGRPDGLPSGEQLALGLPQAFSLVQIEFPQRPIGSGQQGTCQLPLPWIGSRVDKEEFGEPGPRLAGGVKRRGEFLWVGLTFVVGLGRTRAPKSRMAFARSCKRVPNAARTSRSFRMLVPGGFVWTSASRRYSARSARAVCSSA